MPFRLVLRRLAQAIVAFSSLAGCADRLDTLARGEQPLIEIESADLEAYLAALPRDEYPTFYGREDYRKFAYRLAATYGAEIARRFPPGSRVQDLWTYLERRGFICDAGGFNLVNCGRALAVRRFDPLKPPPSEFYLLRIEVHDRQGEIRAIRSLGLWLLDPIWKDLPLWREETKK